jgi:hypothetical protein
MCSGKRQTSDAHALRLGRTLLENLPETSKIVANPHLLRSYAEQARLDAGINELLLTPYDNVFSPRSLRAAAADAKLSLSSWFAPALYNVSNYYIHGDPVLKEVMRALPVDQQEDVAAISNGVITTHMAFFVHDGTARSVWGGGRGGII